MDVCDWIGIGRDKFTINADSKFKTKFGNFWAIFGTRECPQVTDDADLNLVTKVGNL